MSISMSVYQYVSMSICYVVCRYVIVSVCQYVSVSVCWYVSMSACHVGMSVCRPITTNPLPALRRSESAPH
jgi:hypothetical protein